MRNNYCCFTFYKVIYCILNNSLGLVSRDDVASSNRIIEDFFSIALAIEILCFWPPDNFTPFSPTIVSYLFGNFSINSSAAAYLQAKFNCSALALGFYTNIIFNCIVEKDNILTY